MAKRTNGKLSPHEWNLLADLLEIASKEHPQLLGFRMCEASARMIGTLRKLELDKALNELLKTKKEEPKNANSE